MKLRRTAALLTAACMSLGMGASAYAEQYIYGGMPGNISPTVTVNTTPYTTPYTSPYTTPTYGYTAYQGQCGPSAYWSVSGTTLTISGSGSLYTYYSAINTPWAS
ncbi:MAG: hypothetical protein IJ080_08440 [Oscillospiraceae bacterium]|nr:hypothetical protein [Oscillospiraceae bacterium]